VTADVESLEGKLKQLGQRVAFASITATTAPRPTCGEARLFPFPWLEEMGLPRSSSAE